MLLLLLMLSFLLLLMLSFLLMLLLFLLFLLLLLSLLRLFLLLLFSDDAAAVVDAVAQFVVLISYQHHDRHHLNFHTVFRQMMKRCYQSSCWCNRLAVRSMRSSVIARMLQRDVCSAP